MSAFHSWLKAPFLNLHRGRQSLSAAEHAEILAPLASDAPAAQALRALRARMFAGEKVNRSEDRAAGHWALRIAGLETKTRDVSTLATAAQDLIDRMRDSQMRAKSIATAIREGRLHSSTGRPFQTVVHLDVDGDVALGAVQEQGLFRVHGGRTVAPAISGFPAAFPRKGLYRPDHNL